MKFRALSSLCCRSSTSASKCLTIEQDEVLRLTSARGAIQPTAFRLVYSREDDLCVLMPALGRGIAGAGLGRYDERVSWDAQLLCLKP